MPDACSEKTIESESLAAPLPNIGPFIARLGKSLASIEDPEPYVGLETSPPSSLHRTAVPEKNAPVHLNLIQSPEQKTVRTASTSTKHWNRKNRHQRVCTSFQHHPKLNLTLRWQFHKTNHGTSLVWQKTASQSSRNRFLEKSRSPNPDVQPRTSKTRLKTPSSPESCSNNSNVLVLILVLVLSN